jgi:hypothetical protein
MTLRRESLAALALLAVVGAAWVESASIPGEARLFPRLILGLMGVLSAIMLVQSLRRPSAGSFFVDFGNFVITVLIAGVYISLVEPLGYLLATSVFIPVLAVALGMRRPQLLAVTTIGFVVVVYLIFVIVFDRPLPLGILSD